MRRTLTWIISLLLVAALVLEAYTRLPSDAAIEALNLPADTNYVVLFFHGTGGKDEPLLREITGLYEEELSSQPGTVVKHVVWSPWSDNRLRARAHAQLIGKQLGTELAGLEQLEFIRVIIHSAGAYLLTPMCEAYRENHLESAPRPAHFEMTYLDGMGIHGGWDYYYGYRNYGECADYSGNVYNSDETVPGTNAPLAQSYNIDVTAAPMRSDINGHLWPLEYYRDTLTTEEMTPGLRSHEQRPRGTVDTITGDK
jgi:hypothetical protein